METFNKLILLLTCTILSYELHAQVADPDIKAKQKKNPYYSHTDTKPINLPDAEWKKILSRGEYQIAREEATERAYTGAYWDNHKKGSYYCTCCGNYLFSSATKFESGTGWPSFYKAATATSLREKADADGSRTEVECKRCGAHLGHVFNDGPKPTGLRYCINSAVLDFVAARYIR